MPQKAAKRATKHANNAQVRVRMYRHGLGDCFLVTMPGKGAKPFHLMIDCGVVLGTPDAEARMCRVVENIIAETGGRVDVLAITHEHWDHVSGFIQAEDLFAARGERRPGRLSVGELWLAWTEEPGNPLALKLKQEQAEKVQKLRVAAQQLRAAAAAAGSDASAIADGIEEVLGFFGAAGGRSTPDAMEAARRLVPGKPRYCRPADDPIPMEGSPGFRVFVLGPPENETLIKRLNSSKELYKDEHAFGPLDWSLGMTPAAERGPESDGTPFGVENCIPLEEVRQRLEALAAAERDSGDGQENRRPGGNYEGNHTLYFFDRYYFGKAADSPYTDQRWRRIDGAWLGAASEFALQIDNATNNTSLALAIEHIPSEKVLLFAADAQLGNWLSWQDVKWKSAEKTITGPDLLNRTVVYKVGHHGSHNATLKEKGLEMMLSDELAALVPVDHEMAVSKGWARMPMPVLMSALRKRTRGRVLRIDEDFREDRLDSDVRSGFGYARNELYYDVFVPLERARQDVPARRKPRLARGAASMGA